MNQIHFRSGMSIKMASIQDNSTTNTWRQGKKRFFGVPFRLSLTEGVEQEHEFFSRGDQ